MKPFLPKFREAKIFPKNLAVQQADKQRDRQTDKTDREAGMQAGQTGRRAD